jgi:hypothetical protein
MATEGKKKAFAKGGRKGGSQFPRVELKQAIEFTKRLVSKTHTGPQPEKIVLPGVFNNAGSVGRIRASALKQYDLLVGSPQAYEASQLAKKIDAAPKEDLSNLYPKACLNPKLFKTLYETFQGDSVSRAKIRQQAANLQVHPDSLDECVDLFTKSVVFAGLGVTTEQNGDVQFTRGQLQSTTDNTNDFDEDNPTGSKEDDDRTAAIEKKLPPPAGRL